MDLASADNSSVERGGAIRPAPSILGDILKWREGFLFPEALLEEPPSIPTPPFRRLNLLGAVSLLGKSIAPFQTEQS